MTAYYNEHDPFAAQWLRNLIKAGLIAPGDVDDRSITDISADELTRYTQCHFFAGIGVWSHALRNAGWADSRPVWTGSCPCQPFSVTGKRKGAADKRHLWPVWGELIKKCEPSVVFGEQVASAEIVGKVKGDSRQVWLDIVSTDLENAQYAVAPFDIPAACFGAPHIRPRIYFVAERMGNASCESCKRNAGEISATQAERPKSGYTDGRHNIRHSDAGETSKAGPVNGFWRNADWIGFRDQKFRPSEPGSQPLADGTTNRMGKIRAYGNAICAEVATGFISAYMDIH